MLFYILQTKLSLDKYFTKLHTIISSACDFFYKFRRLFCCGLHNFSQKVVIRLHRFRHISKRSLLLFLLQYIISSERIRRSEAIDFSFI
jgi:hypothetical protein